MSKKHLIITDADEGIEYDVEEIDEVEDPEKVEETEEVAEESDKVCPECGKDPCECKSAKEAVFTEEEIAALKDLISIVPALKDLVAAKADEKVDEQPKEQEEIKEIEEVKEQDDEIVDEDDAVDECDETDSVTDSVGSLEQTVGDGVTDDEMSAEATMAERFKKYYGGN